MNEDAKGVWSGWQCADIRRSMVYQDDNLFDVEEAKAFVFFSAGKGSEGRDMAITCDGEFAGCISWQYGKGLFRRSAEIGYWVLPAFRGRGCARGAIECAKEFLFENRAMHRIQARVSHENQASCQALIAAGFWHEATLQDAFWIDGIWYHCEVFAYVRKSE